MPERDARRRGQRGSAAVLFAVAVFGLAGFAAISLDAARLYVERARMRAVVSASALAGAQHLPADPDGATDTTRQYLQKNGVDPAVAEITIPADDPRELQVKVVRSLDLTFARLLGYTRAESGHVAVAYRGVLKRVGGPQLVPLGLVEQPLTLGETYSLLVLPGEQNSPGNFGYLDYGGKGGGADELRQYLRDGYPSGYQVGDRIWTKTGVIKNVVKSELQDRIDSDPTATPATVARDSRRLLIVPVYSKPPPGTSDQVEIRAFAICFLQSVSIQGGDVVVDAVFLNYNHDGEIERGPAVDYGANAVKLISD